MLLAPFPDPAEEPADLADLTNAFLAAFHQGEGARALADQYWTQLIALVTPVIRYYLRQFPAYWDDAVNDTIMAIQLGGPGFDPAKTTNGTIAPWARRIATFKAIDQFRRLIHRNVYEVPPPSGFDDRKPPYDPPEKNGGFEGPTIDRVDRAAGYRRLAEALRRIEPLYGELIVRRYRWQIGVGDFRFAEDPDVRYKNLAVVSWTEVAAMLGRSEDECRTILHPKARRDLRREWARLADSGK